MLQVVHAPPDLAAAVEAAIVVRHDAGSATSRFPAMPRAMLTAGPDAAPVLFHTPTTRPVTFGRDGPLAACGLVLLPAAAAGLLGPTTGALVNQVLPWAELAGRAEARRLDDALAQSGTDRERLRALFDSLRRTLDHGAARVQAARSASLQRLCHEVGRHGVQAAPLLGCGERQLERRCRSLLGMSPKRLQRLVRFHAALSAAVRTGRPHDAAGALDAGYYDQSHLARESRALAGEPLAAVLAGAHDDGAWWPLLAQRALRHHR